MNEFNNLNTQWIKDNQGQAANDYIRMLEQSPNSKLTYYGFARSEWNPNQPYWRIARKSLQGGVWRYEFAGTGQFDQVWARRASLFTSTWANNYSVLFDGVNDRIDVTNVNILSTLTDQYTISAWVKTGDLTAPTTRNIFSVTSSTVATRALMRLYFNSATNSFSFQVSDNAGVTANANAVSSISSNSWYHVLGVRSGNSISLYINGVLAASGSASLGAITVDAINMGARNNGGSIGEFWRTNIDEVTLWKRAFDANEATEIYNFGEPANPKEHSRYSTNSSDNFLLSYWAMGDGDTYPTLLDQISANNGTIINGVATNIQTLTPGTDNTFSPSYLDSGDIAAGASFTEAYPAVPSGEIHQIDDIFIESTVNYKVELKVDGVIKLTIIGAPRVSSPPRPIPDIKLSAGQVLTIVKYNQNAINAASIYSTLKRTRLVA